MARTDKTVDDLLQEMERPAPALPPGRSGEEGFSRRLLAAELLLGMGFGAGWFAASLLAPLTAGAGAKEGVETRRDLLAAGCSEAD